MSDNKDAKSSKKWTFADYAFLITGVVVGFLLVVPDILYAQFGISILGGNLGDESDIILAFGEQSWDINSLRALSPMLFLMTTTIVMFNDAISARKSGGYKGSVFTYTFEGLVEDAIYMATTTVMVYSAVFAGAMYVSWLAGPITWVLFVFILPFIKRRRGGASDEVKMPWLLLLIFAGGVVTEIITGAWIAFPLSWLVICAIKFVRCVREFDYTVDTAFDIMYYAFSVVLIALGVALDMWIVSWIAFPIALVICWILSKFKRFKKASKSV